MSMQHTSPAALSNNGSARTDLHVAVTAQSSGVLGETMLCLLLAALLLFMWADVARAAERGTAAHAHSAAAGMPTYNIEALCRDAASVAHLLETTAPDNAQNCIQDERQAREELLEQWSRFDIADRVMCDGAARSGTVEAAYTELMTCLEMTRDNHTREANAHVARRPDQPQAPGAVTAAPVQRPGPIRSALAGR